MGWLELAVFVGLLHLAPTERILNICVSIGHATLLEKTVHPVRL